MLVALLCCAFAVFTACAEDGEEELPEATPLAAPVIELDGNVVSWEAVSGATSYTVYVNDDGTSVTGTSYTLTMTEAGSYTIYVIANSTNAAYTDSARSNTVTYTVEQTYPLAAPVIELDGNVVSWDAVEHAVSYTVTVNGTAQAPVTATSYTITETTPGGYTVTVVANAEAGTNYVNSPASNSVTYTVPDTPVLSALEVTGFTKTLYYLDERAQAPDLSGVTVTASYTAGKESAAVDLTDCTVTYDGEETADMTAGSHTIRISYTEEGVTLYDELTYTVERRAEADIEAITEMIGEYDAADGSYAVAASGTVTAVTDLDGNAAAFSGNAIGNDAFGTDEYVKVFRVDLEGGTTNFVRVIRATYVSDVAGFKAINERLNGYYILRQSIDFASSYADTVTIGAAPIGQATEGFKIETEGAGSEVAGTAFTGVFDGNGYALMNYRRASEAYTSATEGYGLAVFGWIGEGGVVKNLTLRNVSIHGGQDCALLAAFNQGTIENIVVEESCTLYSNYGNGGLTDVNFGTIQNVVSFLTKYGDRNGSESRDFGWMTTSSTYSDVTQPAAVNAHISADREEIAALTAIDGWEYFEGVGTVYTNAYYIYIPSGAYELPLGSSIRLPIAAKQNAFVFAVYTVEGGATGVTLEKLSLSVQDGVLTVGFAENGAEGVTAGAFTLLVRGEAGWMYSQTITVTLTAAIPVSATVATQNIEVYQGGQLALNTVELTVIYSDGSQDTVNPTSVTVDTSTVGDAVAATFFYTEGDVTVQAEATVKVVEDTSDDPVPTAFAVTPKVGAIVIPYADGWTVNFNEALLLDAFIFTTTLPDEGGTVDLDAWNNRVTFEASANTYGNITFTFVYSYKTARFEQEVTIGVYYGISNEAELQAATADGAAWYALTADIPVTEARSTVYFSAFSGVFDGNGYTISNLNLNSDAAHLAFIDTLAAGGVVRNLGMQGAVTSTAQYSAGLVSSSYGLIENCYVNVSVSGSRSIGGIVYENFAAGVMRNNVFVGSLTETGTAYRAGGIAGVSRVDEEGGYNNVYLTGGDSTDGKYIVGKRDDALCTAWDATNALATDFAAFSEANAAMLATFDTHVWTLDSGFALNKGCLTTLTANAGEGTEA